MSLSGPIAVSPTPAAPASTAERRLYDALRRLAASRSRWFAVHVHLSTLPAARLRPQSLRTAIRPFEALVALHEAQVFSVAGGDLVLLCRDVPVEEVDVALYRLRALVGDEAMTGACAIDDEAFVSWYDLSQKEDYELLLAFARSVAADDAPGVGSAETCAPAASAGRPLAPAELSGVLRRLQEVRIADFVRQQTALEVLQGGRARPLFLETYVSMTELGARVAPGADLFASPWLFQYLTQFLDRRLMVHLARQSLAREAVPISINLNVGTVATREFARFSETHGARPGHIIVEILLTDALADARAFARARAALSDRGYPVLIDGISPWSPQFLSVAALRPDLVKIWWGRGTAPRVSPESVAALRDMVERCGKDSVVLARADSEEAVKWALDLGIQRFQGRFIDRLVEAMTGRARA